MNVDPSVEKEMKHGTAYKIYKAKTGELAWQGGIFYLNSHKFHSWKLKIDQKFATSGNRFVLIFLDTFTGVVMGLSVDLTTMAERRFSLGVSIQEKDVNFRMKLGGLFDQRQAFLK